MEAIVIDFLRELAANNNREWFQSNKSRYDQAKSAVEHFVGQLLPAIGAFDEQIKFVAAKDCMFRIFRDVRFSKNKEPYKTNMGAWITRSGRKSSGPGYYLHIEPGKSFLAAGVYMPEPAQLKNIRSEIYYNAGEFISILHQNPFADYFNGIDEMDKAKTAPRDFPKDFEHIDILKNRHYTVSCPISDQQITDQGFGDFVVQVFKAAWPYNSFLKRGLEG